MSDSLRPYGLQPTRLLCPCDFPGKSTGVGCHCLLRNCPLGESKSLNSKCEDADGARVNYIQRCQWKCSLLYPRWRSFLSHKVLFSVSLLQCALPLVLFQVVIWQVFFPLQPKLESPLLEFLWSLVTEEGASSLGIWQWVFRVSLKQNKNCICLQKHCMTLASGVHHRS